MPKLYNKYAAGVPADAVNIMRPSIWGNPFSHQRGTTSRYRVATREEAVERYWDWLWTVEGRSVMVTLGALRGRDLVCCCAPKRCHGEALLDLANHDNRYCAKCDDEFTALDEAEERRTYCGLALCWACSEEL